MSKREGSGGWRRRRSEEEGSEVYIVGSEGKESVSDMMEMMSEEVEKRVEGTGGLKGKR